MPWHNGTMASPSLTTVRPSQSERVLVPPKQVQAGSPLPTHLVHFECFRYLGISYMLYKSVVHRLRGITQK